jgi:DNA-binding SARP family transcriptional activator
MAQVQTEPAHGIETLQEALGGFRVLGDVQGQILCLAALLNAANLGYSAVEAMDGWLDELLAKMDQLQAVPSPDVELRVWGVLCSALFWSRPWHPWTASAAHRVEALLARGGAPAVALAAAASALSTTSTSGEFECGDRITEATAHLVNGRSASPSEAAWWLARAGYLRFVEARYEEALDFIRRACEVAESNGMRATFAITIYTRFMVEFRVSGWTVANATLAEMEAMPRPNYPVGEAMLYVYQARRAQFRGRCDEAADLAELTHAAILRTGSQYQEMLFGMVNADLLLNAGRIEKARPLIVWSRDLIERAPVFDCFLAALVFAEAWLALVEGTPDLALTRLRESLSLARDGNRKYYLRYLECAMPPMFTLALEEAIEVDLVQEIIRKFRLKPSSDAPDTWPWPVRIFTLGRFKVQIDGENLEFPRKLPRKTLLLLKAIVALGGRDVPEQALCDALWGDEEGDAARNALSITVLRLRKLLGSNETVLQQGGRISLNAQMCWVDAWVFEARHADRGFDSQKVLALYGGNFLPEDEGESWSVAPRERLRGKFIDALSRYSAVMESEGDLLGAVQCYMRGIDADPIVESFQQGLMRCYERLGKRTEALGVYRRLKHTLSVVLGVPPSDAVQRLFQDMLRRQAEEGPVVEPEVAVLGAASASAPARTTGIVTKLPVRRTRSR